MSSLRSVSLLALVGAALSAHADVVTFDNVVLGPDAVSEDRLHIDGLTFKTDFYVGVFSGTDLAANGASNGTQALINSTTLDVTRFGGGNFFFTGFDYGQSYYSDPTGEITLTLNLAGGGSYAYTLFSSQSRQWIETNVLVSSVTIRNESYGYVMIDNFGFVNAPSVPGPLAALPFALIALNRRRKRA